MNTIFSKSLQWWGNECMQISIDQLRFTILLKNWLRRNVLKFEYSITTCLYYSSVKIQYNLLVKLVHSLVIILDGKPLNYFDACITLILKYNIIYLCNLLINFHLIRLNTVKLLWYFNDLESRTDFVGKDEIYI